MKKLLFSVLLLFCFLGSYAAYLVNVPQTVKQPDGTILHCFASGDEFYSWLHDSLGYTIVENAQGYYVYALPAADGQIAPSKHIVGIADPVALNLPVQVNIASEIIVAKRAEFEATMEQSRPQKAGSNVGTINNIVIFIRFSDESGHSKNFNYMNTAFNDSSSLSANSVYNFFKLASYGQLHIVSHFYPAPNGSVIVSYQDINPRSYYRPYSSTNTNGFTSSNRQSREHALLTRAVNYVTQNKLIPPTLNLDYDGDGQVDNVCFMISGNPIAGGDILWPHRWSLSRSANVMINGKRVIDYNLNLENINGSNTCAGVITHEMMHTLGAPDLYRYNNNGNPVGNWDLMASTNYTKGQGLGAYMKYRYGKWIPSPLVITNPGTYTLYPINNNSLNYDPQKPIAYMINLPDNPNEYLVLEYRKTNSCTFESGLPGSGLLIYRINTNRAPHGNASADGTSTYDEVYIFRPGGTKTANGTIAEAHFSANANRTIFSETTSAYPFYCNGNAVKSIAIANVTAAGDSIQFTYLATTLDVSKNQVDFDYQSGNTDTFSISSNVSWTITGVDTTWLNVNILSGDSGKTNIQLSTLTQNNLRVPKTCTLLIRALGRETSINISQGVEAITSCQGVNNQCDEDVMSDYNFQQYNVNAVSEYFASTGEMQVVDSVSFYFGNISINESLDNTLKLEIYTSNASNRPGTTVLVQNIDARNLTPNAWNTIKLQKPVISNKGLTVGYSFTRTDADFVKINIFRNNTLRTEPYFGTMFVKLQNGNWRNPSEVSFSGIKNYSLAMKLFVCPPSPDTDTLLVSASNLPMPYDSNVMVSFDITSNTDWEIAGLSEDYSVSQSTGTGNATIEITSLSKHKEAKKMFYFWVRSGSILRDMTIERATYPLVSNKKEVELNYEGTDSAEVYITAIGTDWEAQTSCSWLHLPKTTGTAGMQKLVIYPTGANNTSLAFEGCVDINSTTLNENICIVVRQKSAVGIQPPANASLLSLYPNPASSQLFVNSGNRQMQTIIIYNVIGSEVLKVSDVNSSHTELNIADLQAGLYFIKVISTENVQVKKFVKK